MKVVVGSRGVMAVLAAVVVLFGGMTVTAQAEPTDPSVPAADCSYPSFCFIKDGEVVDEYHDVTPWQYLPQQLQAPLQVINARHESVWIGDTRGGARCIEPGAIVDLWLVTIDTVRVDDSVECRLT
ncbi:hypothetical protein [Streptomyces zagrosensis]|uniref:Uncharacterized protein n=1 Tax=Streptomyces zagrosensis TaxID=1042984 RepID=A0A7W9QGD7_9ACTN|nr:hypothetical protein [Streptomyces zagrosensis]MBB5939770.1 hypothetical protein [Streptomyces zagrosensis]